MKWHILPIAIGIPQYSRKQRQQNLLQHSGFGGRADPVLVGILFRKDGISTNVGILSSSPSGVWANYGGENRVGAGMATVPAPGLALTGKPADKEWAISSQQFKTDNPQGPDH
jgi:hypothetical protein